MKNNKGKSKTSKESTRPATASSFAYCILFFHGNVTFQSLPEVLSTPIPEI